MSKFSRCLPVLVSGGMLALALGCEREKGLHVDSIGDESLVVQLQPTVPTHLSLSLTLPEEVSGLSVCWLFVEYEEQSPVQEVEIRATAPGFDERVRAVRPDDTLIDFTSICPSTPFTTTMAIEVLLVGGSSGEVTISSHVSFSGTQDVDVVLTLEEVP